MGAGVGKVTRKINTTTHADSTTVLVESHYVISELIKQDKNNSERVGLYLKLQKARIMRTVEKVNIFLDGEDNSTVFNYKFFIVLITHDSYINEEIKEILLNKPAMENLTKIIKFLEVSTNTKVKLLQTTVFLAVLYGCKGKKIKD